jgi:hypothetical protein
LDNFTQGCGSGSRGKENEVKGTGIPALFSKFFNFINKKISGGSGYALDSDSMTL